MSRPGTRPTSVKMPASLSSSRLPKRPRRNRMARRMPPQTRMASSRPATTTLAANSQL
jgi:hypothetical protein